MSPRRPSLVADRVLTDAAHTFIDLAGALPGFMQYSRESRIPKRTIPPRALAAPRARAELFGLDIDRHPPGDEPTPPPDAAEYNACICELASHVAA